MNYGSLPIITAEMTRAANTTGYDANDVVAPAAGGLLEITNVARYNGGSGYITGIRVSTDKKSITPRFRLHFFNASTPTLSADGANWQDKYADASKRLGYYDMPAMTTAADSTNSDMSRSLDLNVPRIPFICATTSRSVFVGIETLDAFTPASGEKFTIALNVDLN